MEDTGACLPDTPTIHQRELPIIQVGTFGVYQFLELGDSIDLEQAQTSLSTPVSRRQPPPRVRQSDSIQIAQPPLVVELGAVVVELEGMRLEGALRASIYDLGAVALMLMLPLPGPTGWETVADLFGAAQDLPQRVQRRFLIALAGIW